MSDIRLQEELAAKLESFVRDQIIATADRACDLAHTLLRREGNLSYPPSNEIIVGGRPLRGPVSRSLCELVAEGTGLLCAVFQGHEPVAVAPRELTGGRFDIPDDVATTCLVRDDSFVGTVDIDGRPMLVAARPIRVDGHARGVVLCGQFTAEANTTLLGLSTIQEEIVELAEKLQRERQQAVGDFLKSIRSIAKRIHLLALNASILSAQAGEHGRGFAVVAREIGDLAERTRQSSQELEHFLGRAEPDVPVDRRHGGRRTA